MDYFEYGDFSGLYDLFQSILALGALLVIIGIAAAGGKRADVVKRRVIITVRIPAGGFFHQPSRVIISLLLRTENPIPHIYGLIL